MTAKKATPPAAVPAAQPAQRFDLDRMTPEVGWMMIGVGVLGVILPGLPGWPFFLIGGAVLVPGGKRRVGRWLDNHQGPVTDRSLKIVERFMDDLDEHYPQRR